MPTDILALVREKHEDLKENPIQSKRCGKGWQTGNAIEALYGIAENNIPQADFKVLNPDSFYTLKTSGSNSSLTLCSLKPDELAVLIEGYTDIGYKKPNNRGLKLEIDEYSNKLLITHKGAVIGYYSLETLNNLVTKELSGIVLHKGVTDKKTGLYYHKHTHIIPYSMELFMDQLKTHKLKVCFRVGKTGHDHGTGFRINPTHLIKLATTTF